MDTNSKNNSSFLKTKKTGFSMPKNYFSSFNEELTSKLTETKINVIKENNFKTPENYFDNIEDEILNKIGNTTKRKVVNLYPSNIKIISSIAASLLLVFIISNYFNTNKNSISELSLDEIEYWYENGYVTINSLEYASLTEGDNNIYLNELQYTTINNTAIEEYLINEDFQIDSIE